MTHSLSTSEARERFADVLDEVAFKGERVLLHRRGKPVAAMISADDLALLETLEDRFDLEAVRAALAEPGSNVSWEQLRAEAGL